MKNTQFTILMLLANCGTAGVAPTSGAPDVLPGSGHSAAVPQSPEQRVTSADETPVIAAPAAARFTIAVDRSELPADGVQVATVTFTVSDADGQPVSEVALELTSTGTGDSIVAPSTTDADGHASATIASTSTEVKHLRAQVAGSALTAFADVTFTSGAAATLRFVVLPTSSEAGVALAPAVVVAVQDANGNLVRASDLSVTLALHDNPGEASLTGTRTVSAIDGVATFADLSLDQAADGYTFAASAEGVATAVSGTLSITSPL